MDHPLRPSRYPRHIFSATTGPLGPTATCWDVGLTVLLGTFPHLGLTIHLGILHHPGPSKVTRGHPTPSGENHTGWVRASVQSDYMGSLRAISTLHRTWRANWCQNQDRPGAFSCSRLVEQVWSAVGKLPKMYTSRILLFFPTPSRTPPTPPARTQNQPLLAPPTQRSDRRREKKTRCPN